MSNTINNGGPAFPAGHVHKSRQSNDPDWSLVEIDRVQPLHQGLSMRDYFAARAMQSYVALDDMTEDGIAASSYELADAMLRARGEA